MSLAWQPVSFEVECRTFDEIPVAFGATGSFRLRYDLRALAAVARAFGGNHGTMKDHVKACYMGQLRDVVGASTAADIDRNAGHATAEAMRRSVHILSRDGFELSPLVAERVDFSDEWRNEQGQRQVLEARSHRVTRELEIERAVHRERAMFAAMEQEIKAEATAKSNSIIELERIRIAEAHLALNRKKRSDDREHEQAMAVIEAFRLAEMLRTKAGYHEVLIQQQIVERLPEILEAKGKLVPNLRTYIGGSQGKGLVELITGLAAIGPDIMPELRDVINSLSKSGSPDAITGPDPGPATGPRPGDGSQIVPPDDAETP
ncbi:hypothetical protein CC117_31160 [Parafrankia colletiae]|uniref:Uncharacterized protein n=2 Tax=Parafrankia colletiae TaxID=573497 RepID=A0A1S1Q1W2_9ACTN|nr:hypothetical protein CC117_31160 [Parafrankia colletiae]